ncbi:MAG: adenylate kinase [Acidobacteria bacterium]|nr:adenylate kinase [Acidobacteriota bacterium]
MAPILILLGAPGSGKGTQAKRIEAELHFPQISTGDILREALRRETPLGLKARAAMDAGELVPDDVVIGIIEERLQHDDCTDGCVMDGFPRTVAQAEALGRLVQNRFQMKVIQLDVPEEDLMKRLTGRRNCVKCGAISNVYFSPAEIDNRCDLCGGELVQRADDTAAVVRNRLAVYRQHTEPLIAYYDRQHLLHTVDAQGDVSEIFDRINRLIRQNGSGAVR